eukprot:scpid21033/ scgid18643/ DIS3-like exonuclease 1
MASSAIYQTQRKFRVRNNAGIKMTVVREHYLRNDLPCQSQLCQSCPELEGYSASLTADASHYVIPDTQVAETCFDVLDHPGVTSVVWLQTILAHVQKHVGRRHYDRLRAHAKNSQKESAVFINEHHVACWKPYSEPEFASMQDWTFFLIHRAASYLSSHLDSKMPIVIVTRSQQYVDEFCNRQSGVFVVLVSDYVQNFWSHDPTLVHVFESLSASWDNEAAASNGSHPGSHGRFSGFTPHRPAHELQEGLRSGRYVRGKLRVSKYFSRREAYVDTSRSAIDKKDTGRRAEILISGINHRNRAVHNDDVVVEILPNSQWASRTKRLAYGDAALDQATSDSSTPSGRVVGILTRNWRDYVVLIPAQDSDGSGSASSSGATGIGDRVQKILVYPFDIRIPKIRIATRHGARLRGQRFVVRIDSWDKNSQYPNGHFVDSLGACGELETEISTILIENQISVSPFTSALEMQLPVNTAERPWRMDPAEVARRRDLRDTHLIFSIDPKGCEDVDDTLSARRLANGRIELGVHIADVTHFVKPGSCVDKAAESRATTVYLADRRFDMLPSVLSSDLCSLHSSVDRYAVSVFCEMDEDFNIKKVRFFRTVIRSRYKLEYGVAQSVIDGASNAQVQANVCELKEVRGKELNDNVQKMRTSLHLLSRIASARRRQRDESGALELESNEVGIVVSKDKKSIEDILPKQSLAIHETVAECMIFANELVARQIAKHFPQHALLRRHAEPKFDNVDELLACAEAKDFSISTESNTALAQSLNNCQDSSDPNVNTVMRMLATRAMSQAQYISLGSAHLGNTNHYGLALEKYTHFTSPIRRYADVIVHRQLLSTLQEDTTSNAVEAYSNLPKLAEHLNSKKRDSDIAQKESLALFQTLYFQSVPADSDACVTTVIVYQILRNGLKVYSPRFGLNGPVYLQNKDGLVLQRASPDSDQPVFGSGTITPSTTYTTVSGVSSSCKFSLFDHLKVRIELVASDLHPPSLRYHLMSCDTVLSSTVGSPDHTVLPNDASSAPALASSAKDCARANAGPQSSDMARFDLVKAVSKSSSGVTTAQSVSAAMPGGVVDDESAEEMTYRQTKPSDSLYHTLLAFQKMALEPNP